MTRDVSRVHSGTDTTLWLLFMQASSKLTIGVKGSKFGKAISQVGNSHVLKKELRKARGVSHQATVRQGDQLYRSSCMLATSKLLTDLSDGEA